MVDNMTGYESKRAAARDRMLDDDDTLTIAYQSGFYDGKKAAQSAQEPVANDRALQLVTYQMNHWKAYALELQERLVKYEGGAPMLLNKENNT